MSNIRKVLLVSTLLRGKGGMETVVRTFISELDQRGIHVKLVLLGKYKLKKHDLTWLHGIDYELLLPDELPNHGLFRNLWINDNQPFLKYLGYAKSLKRNELKKKYETGRFDS